MGNCSSPLRQAIQWSATDVKTILDEAGAGAPDIINEDFTADCLFDSCQNNVFSVMHTALASGKMETFELLLRYGGDTNIPTGNLGETVLHQAARQNKLAAVKLIVQHGADLMAKDFKGQFAIHFAASSQRAKHTESISVLQFLVEEAGKVEFIHMKDAQGNTPLHAAAKIDNLAAVTYLLEKGADPTVRNKKGRIPADLCASSFKQNFTKR